jgi:hypothetical protein
MKAGCAGEVLRIVGEIGLTHTISAIVSPCIAIEGGARAAAMIIMDIAASFENPDIFKSIPPYTSERGRCFCA